MKVLKLETLKSEPAETFTERGGQSLFWGKKNIGDLGEKIQLPTRMGYVAHFVEINSTL